MSLTFKVLPLACAASLLAALSSCAQGDDDDTGEPLEQNVNPAESDSGVKADAAIKDAGRKDAGKNNTVDAPPVIKVDGGAEVLACGSASAEAELARGPVDIIIGMDTSLSMAPQVCNVSTNLTAFANTVGESSHVVSVYEMGALAVATALFCGNPDPLASTPLAMDASRYLHRAVNIDSWNALNQISAQYDSYKAFLRPNAPTHIIVVSDDQSDPLRGGLLAADFKAQMEQKLGHPFFFHAIVADGQNGCLGSGIGTEYLALSEQTGGEKLSICATDWTVLFKQLEAAVVNSAPIPCDFEIPPPPSGEELDPDAVQVVFEPPGESKLQFPRAASAEQCAGQTAWHYDNDQAPTRIELCPASCDAVKAGGNVDIAFGCAPDFVM